MKKVISILVLLLAFVFYSPDLAYAQNSAYVIPSFDSEVTINQDASITVKETIKVQFRERRHGIIRSIPVVYRSNGKVINSRFAVLGITGPNGDKYKYSKDRDGDYMVLKIGDADKYVTGSVTYVISYRMRNIIQRFDDHDELYWNVAGDAWDTEILSTHASVRSDFANFKNIQCFSGAVKSVESKCDFQKESASRAIFTSNSNLGLGRDMTIVLALDKNNQLTFAKSLGDYFSDYSPYAVVIFPILLIGFMWLKYGRDIKYKGDNIYYEPSEKSTHTVSLFERKFLPMVYSPIKGLTPAEVGTLIDERVDIHDVVAEIIELARLGHLKIEKLDKKWAKDDYVFTKIHKDTKNLRDYQKYLLDEIFKAGKKDQVNLSELKNKFYTSLAKFKEKLYTHVHDQKYFISNPNTTRILWLVVTFALGIFGFGAAIVAIESNGDFIPMILLVVSAPIALLLAWNMPRRTPTGYSLYRQIQGLAFYINKGKWRHEIGEKHLFLEEILPLAISLGVVKKLAHDMQELGVKPPSYFNVPATAWASSLSGFNSVAASSLAAGAKSSGGWSGGSGFSGGSAGGGFGGGGGGSW